MADDEYQDRLWWFGEASKDPVPEHSPKPEQRLPYADESPVVDGAPKFEAFRRLANRVVSSKWFMPAAVVAAVGSAYMTARATYFAPAERLYSQVSEVNASIGKGLIRQRDAFAEQTDGRKALKETLEDVGPKAEAIVNGPALPDTARGVAASAFVLGGLVAGASYAKAEARRHNSNEVQAKLSGAPGGPQSRPADLRVVPVQTEHGHFLKIENPCDSQTAVKDLIVVLDVSRPGQSPNGVPVRLDASRQPLLPNSEVDYPLPLTKNQAAELRLNGEPFDPDELSVIGVYQTSALTGEQWARGRLDGRRFTESSEHVSESGYRPVKYNFALTVEGDGFGMAL